MRGQDIYEKIKSGEIKLNTCGHQINTERLIERYEHDLKLANGSHDNKWELREGESIEKINADMRDFYWRPLNKEINVGETLWTRGEDACFGCAKIGRWVLTDENTLSLIEFLDSIENWKSKFTQTSVDFSCPYAIPKTFTGQITVLSKLIFTNFFSHIEDGPENEKHTQEWSLNYDIGLDNITKHLASQNIAFGQMGNMAISLFVNNDRTSIIVGPSYHPAEFEEYDSDEEYYKALKQPEFEEHERVGESISLPVWRWMAADLLTIGEENYQKHLNEEYPQDVVELDVKHGIWEFEHYYTNQTNPNKAIYSKFILKEPK